MTQSSPTSARTAVGPASTTETRVPSRSSAPADVARFASARSNTPRSMTAASGTGVECEMIAPDGETNCAVVNVLSDASRGRPRMSKLSVASTPVQCTGSPIVACSSQTSVDTPRRASRSAA